MIDHRRYQTRARPVQRISLSRYWSTGFLSELLDLIPEGNPSSPQALNPSSPAVPELLFNSFNPSVFRKGHLCPLSLKPVRR